MLATVESEMKFFIQSHELKDLQILDGNVLCFLVIEKNNLNEKEMQALSQGLSLTKPESLVEN